MGSPGPGLPRRRVAFRRPDREVAGLGPLPNGRRASLPGRMTGGTDVEADVLARLAVLLGGPVERLERLSGGASRETWAFRAEERDLVLRRDPPGRPAEFGSMATEGAVIAACAAAGLAVPAVVAV